MGKLYSARWVNVAWIDALLKRLAILVVSILVSYGLLLLVALIFGEDADPRKRELKQLIYLLVFLGGWIVWNALRVLVDPVRCAISGSFLGDRSAPAPKAGSLAAAGGGPVSQTDVSLRVAQVNSETPPAIRTEFLRDKTEATTGLNIQVMFMGKWAGKGKPATATARYGGVDPVSAGVEPKKLAKEVSDFQLAYMRPPLATAPYGTDEAFLAAWLTSIAQREQSATLSDEEGKALRSLNKWSNGWRLGLGL